MSSTFPYGNFQYFGQKDSFEYALLAQNLLSNAPLPSHMVTLNILDKKTHLNLLS